MNYQDSVNAAAAALKRGEDANWELARLTYECTTSGRTAADLQAEKLAGKVQMEQWTADVRAKSGRGFAVATGHIYKNIWTRFRVVYPGRADVPWSDAYAEVRGGTVGERMVEADFRRAQEHASLEQKRAQFASLARDPDVLADMPTSAEVFTQIVRDNPSAVEAAWRDTDTNVRLSTARFNAREETVEPIRRAQSENKPEADDSTLEHTHFLYGVQSRCEQWAHELREIEAFLRRVDDVNVMTRRSTRRSLELLIDAATRCRDVLPHSYDEPDTEPQDAVQAAQAALKGRRH